MRDPDRIDLIIDDFRRVWKNNPDMRFGQLAVVLTGSTDPYNIEDEAVRERLEVAIAKMEREATNSQS